MPIGSYVRFVMTGHGLLATPVLDLVRAIGALALLWARPSGSAAAQRTNHVAFVGLAWLMAGDERGPADEFVEAYRDEMFGAQAFEDEG